MRMWELGGGKASLPSVQTGVTGFRAGRALADGGEIEALDAKQFPGRRGSPRDADRGAG
jgi:hypothetical protein